MTTPLSFQLSRAALVVGAVFLCALRYGDPAAGSPPPGSEIDGIATVVDGDTIDLAGHRIRLEGIDAPETAQTCTRASGESWDCGRAASRQLGALIQGQSLQCEGVGTDKYARTLALCFLDGEDVNRAMVEAGYAWAFVKYSQRYVGAEQDARAKKIGIWQGPAQPPWEFRHREWNVAESAAPKGCAIKGNVSSKGHIYHLPWSPWYDAVTIDTARGERWFCSESEALAAGWRPARSY